MSLLNVKDLQAGYGKVQVLFNGHINVEPGELVGIVGPNGAGKSTFLGAIAGAVKASHGTIEFGGESIRSKNPEDIVRLGLALVPEGRAIFTDLTVNENLLCLFSTSDAADDLTPVALVWRGLFTRTLMVTFF